MFKNGSLPVENVNRRFKLKNENMYQQTLAWFMSDFACCLVKFLNIEICAKIFREIIVLSVEPNE